MKCKALQITPPDIDMLIASVRGHKVILDADLARICEVPTRALNQAVRRNLERFPADFLFKLTTEEVTELNRSQSVTGSQEHRDPRFAPYAFIMKILDPPPPELPPPEIGFHVREDALTYRVNQKRRAHA